MRDENIIISYDDRFLVNNIVNLIIVLMQFRNDNTIYWDACK